jgi:ATP-dependent protease HslVU (ClpYQ) peptidase subunit
MTGVSYPLRHAEGGMIYLMTTLVAVATPDYAVFAADSQITEDNLRSISISTPKIVSVGKYMLGITGDTRPGDILTYNWKPPAYRGGDHVKHMGKVVIPSIISAFRDQGYDYSGAEKDKDSGFDYLLAFDGEVFHIACDLSFFQSEFGVYALGSGGQFALGYLYSLKKPITQLTRAEHYAKRAVEIASVLDVNTCPPIQLTLQRRGE